MIAITDYDTGNLRSVANALRRIGAEFTVTSDAAVLRQADRVLLPGVGEASSAMAKLRERGLDALIPTLTQPVLGICIGMQLMCLDSEEGDTRCLGIFPAHVVRLRGGENPLKIPHIGWDTVGRLRSPLFDGLGEDLLELGAAGIPQAIAGGAQHIGGGHLGIGKGLEHFQLVVVPDLLHVVEIGLAEFHGFFVQRQDFGFVIKKVVQH